MTFKFVRTAVATAAALAAVASQAATINLVDLGGVAGSQAEQGFNIAAAYWGGMFTNNVTINLGVGFAALGTNVIGQTGSSQMDYSVANWQAGVLATRSASTIDQTLVMPTLTNGGVTALSNGYNGSSQSSTLTTTLDGSQTASRVLWMNTAVVKAVGGTATYGANSGNRDGNVTFSNTFAFDFNPSNGISAGQMDFIGVAIHEIGHALGFVSGIDVMDYYSTPSGPGRGTLGYDLNSTSIFSALDMFRYSGAGVLNLHTGGTTYFSLDGGNTALAGNTFSTGAYNGDGRQASHWKDTAGCTPQLGIMDPTFCYGQMGEVTGLDLAAYDAMGWNLSANALTYATMTTAQIFATAVPEPSSWALMLMGGAGLAGAVRRRRAGAGEEV
jgi:hypothetical protein